MKGCEHHEKVDERFKHVVIANQQCLNQSKGFRDGMPDANEPPMFKENFMLPEMQGLRLQLEPRLAMFVSVYPTSTLSQQSLKQPHHHCSIMQRETRTSCNSACKCTCPFHVAMEVLVPPTALHMPLVSLFMFLGCNSLQEELSMCNHHSSMPSEPEIKFPIVLISWGTPHSPVLI